MILKRAKFPKFIKNRPVALTLFRCNATLIIRAAILDKKYIENLELEMLEQRRQKNSYRSRRRLGVNDNVGAP